MLTQTNEEFHFRLVQDRATVEAERSVASAGIGFDHQAFPLRIIRPVETPPVGDGVHGQVGCVGRGGHGGAAVSSERGKQCRRNKPAGIGNVCGSGRKKPCRLYGVFASVRPVGIGVSLVLATRGTGTTTAGRRSDRIRCRLL